MIRVDNNSSLSLLFADVYCVLSEAFKEFKDIEYRFDFDSKKKAIKRVCLFFTHRKDYYCATFPDNVIFFEYLDMLTKQKFSGLTFVRHTVDISVKLGVKIYSVVLWY